MHTLFFTVHIRSLTTLGRSTDTYSAMLVPFLLRKLPVDTIRNLAREHETSDWTLEELQEALLKEIRIFETSLHTLTPHRANNFGQTSSLPTASFHTNVNAATNSSTHHLVVTTVRAVHMLPPTVIKWALNKPE